MTDIHVYSVWHFYISVSHTIIVVLYELYPGKGSKNLLNFIMWRNFTFIKMNFSYWPASPQFHHIHGNKELLKNCHWSGINARLISYRNGTLTALDDPRPFDKLCGTYGTFVQASTPPRYWGRIPGKIWSAGDEILYPQSCSQLIEPQTESHRLTGLSKWDAVGG